MNILLVLGFFTAVAYVYFRYLRDYLKRRAHLIELGDKFIGLPSVPILGNAHMLPRTSAYDYLEFFIKLANEYAAKGEDAFRVWVGPKLFIVALNGKTVKDIVDNSVEITKGSDYDFIVPWLGTGLLISTGEKWRTRRKMLTPTFHFNMLDGYMDAFNDESKILLKQLDKFVDGSGVDVFPYVKRCALDIICGNGSKRDRAVETLTSFTKNVIAERQKTRKEGQKKSGEGGRPVFLDMLLDFHDQGLLSEEDIREEVDTFMFEGHDTTSSGIGFILWCIACHPEVQDKIATELFSVFGDSDRDITAEDLKELKYLEMSIKESMRMFPPVPFVQRAIVHGDLKLGDKVVPKGAICSIAPVAIHNNKTLDPNCDVYNPDNFLPENMAKKHPYDYIPFSAGLRNCIGQKFALNEEKTMVAWILRKFKLEGTMPFKKNRMGTWVTLIPEFGIPLRITKRVFS